MLEQDGKNFNLSPVDVEEKLSAETGKESLRYTPSKRMFMETKFQKGEIHKTKDIGSLKTNSKIVKKKRHRDKLKLFKLDKHLWEPALQIPQLGKSAKYFKKKNKLPAIDLQVSGSHISGNPFSRNVLPVPQPKPLEYTFDILCLTTNASSPHVVKSSEERDTSEGNVLPTIISPMQVFEPLPKADAKERSHLGDLIVLDSPNPSKPKVCQFDSQLLEQKTNVHVTMNDVVNPKTQPVSFNLLIDTPTFPYSELTAACQQHVLGTLNSFEPVAGHSDNQLISLSTDKLEKEDIVNKPNIQQATDSVNPNSREEFTHLHAINKAVSSFLGTFELEQQSATNSAVIQDGHAHVSVENSNVEYNPSNESKLSNSPLTLHGFPEIHSPSADKIEKQQILISQNPLQMLVDRLNNDPFPKVVRESATVRVRRRAFSFNGAIISSNQCIPLDIVGAGCQSEASEAETVVNGEVPGPPNSGLHISSQKSSASPIEDPKHSFSETEDGADHADYQSTRCCSSGVIVSYHLSQCQIGPSESTAELAINDDVQEPNSTGSIQPAGRKQSVSDGKSDMIVPVEFTDANEEESNRGISENSQEESEECKIGSYHIEVSEIAQNVGLTLDSDTSDKSSTRGLMDSRGPSASNNTTPGLICGNPEETQSSQPPLSDLDTSLPNSPITAQETSSVTVQTLEGLHKDSNVVGSGYSSILPQDQVLDQTPVPSSFQENGIPQDLDPVNIAALVAFEADSNEESGQALQKTPIILGTSSELSNSDVNESNLDRDHSTINISSQTSGGRSKPEIREAELITTPTKDEATPRFEGSCNESSFADCVTPLQNWVLPAGKKFRRSLAIIRNLDERQSAHGPRGRHYETSVEEIIKLQGNNVEATTTPVDALRKRLTMGRLSWMRQITPPPVRRSTFIWSPKITDRGTLYETPHPRKSIYSTPLQQNLARRKSVRVSSPMPRRSLRSPFNQNYSPSSPVQYTIRDLILTICKQSEPCTFAGVLCEESYEGGCKLGEGVFGEVFSISRDGQDTVLKIIPIEGHQQVNGEKQKTYQEVLSELVIAKVLDELRYESSDESNLTCGFAELIATSLVQGSYPETLLRYWEEFDQEYGSDNDHPKIFDEEQLFIVMEQGNGGKDLESYTFSSAKQSLSIFKQIAFSLAVAETSVEFEHRDLHWGNVLVSKTSEKHILYTLNGTQYSVPSNGVKCTIIDYTLSRIKYVNQFPIYNDLGKDPEMFIATGDYQFDIYRLMKKDVEDDWSRFVPKTNARWLHYLLDKMLTKVKYQRKTAKLHKDNFKVLEGIGTWIEDCGSALSIAIRLLELKN